MKQQQGFSIVMAIFILIVLSILGGYMVRLSGVQQTTTVFALQGARAYQAARAGVEWSIARIVDQSGDCSDIAAASPMTFSDINGFSVTLICTSPGSSPYTVGADSLSIYEVEALSEYGNYNSSDYISRKLLVSIVN